MTILCPSCSSENDAHRRFCNACGVTLERLCAACGFANRVTDNFCGGCGVRLDAVVAASPAPARAAETVSVDQAKRDELRTITVMMADLEGFAEMTDVHGRERQTQVMNIVFERLAKQHIVDEFDGYIDKFLDGDIMALFGAPIAHEDAPERALRAAVRMQAELTRLHEEEVIPADTPLKLRIGLNTGPVRVGGVGAGGRMEYTAMGDTVNLAARLMTACAWGQSLISVNTHRRVAGSFELQELEPVKVKGKSQPVRIWSVLAEKRRAARVELALAAGMSRLVGREQALQAIVEAYERAETGRGNVIGICGEAGVGKSRLVYELQQHLAAGPARVVEGRCVSYGANQQYLPIRDLLSELCQIADGDSAGERQAKVTATLAAIGLSAAEYGPPLGFILGLDFGDRAFAQLDPQERRSRLREATYAALQATCQVHALVVFLDDLQWCDAASREILDDLVARCPECRLLIVLAYRPDFQPDYQGLPHFLALTPQRLTVAETRAVVGSLLASRGHLEDETRVDESLAQAVFRKSQGNPFFIDQTVTALLERAEQTGQPTIDFRRGRLLITEEELGSLVPDSVEEILLSRIDKLPEAPRSLLQAASVAMVGRFFRRSALDFVAADPALDAHLALLESRDLIHRENEAEPDAAYVFEHALARDVAYNNLLRAERRRLHGLVGAYLEQHYASSLVAYTDDLAHHFYNSADARKAFHYLPQSAHRAAQVYSNQQAVLQYKRALERADDLVGEGGVPNLPQLRLDVLKGLTQVQALVGDKEGLEYGRQRLELATALHDRDGVIDASYMLAHLHTAVGQFEEAQAAWAQVREQYAATETWDGVRDTEYGIGNLCYLQGRFEAALEHFEAALAIQTERLEFEPFGLWVAHNNLAAAYEAMSRFEAMLEACRMCGELLEKLDAEDPMRLRLECYTSGNLGSAHRNLGNLPDAVAAYERTLEISLATGEKVVEAEARHWLGRTQLLIGSLRAAREQLDEALALARETGSSRWEAGALAGLAEALMLCGDEAAATDLLRQARELLERVGELAGRGDVVLAEARLRLLEDDPEAAVAVLQPLLDGASEQTAGGERAAALAELAAAHWRAGRPEEAARHAAAALSWADRLGAKPVRARALRVRGAALGALADLDEALAVARAMPALEEEVATLGLRATLKRANQPAEAQADLALAEDRLQAAEATAGTDYLTAARVRHLVDVLDPRRA